MHSFAESLDYIYGLNKKRHIRLKFGFDRMNAVLLMLEDMQEKLSVIHVAGTKGKGSTISFLSFILREKFSTGLFTSPSLINTVERFSINGVLMPPEDFLKIATFLKGIYKSLPEELVPTTFETFTIIAFLYFYGEDVDFALLEVGMGGRLDATNIIKKPLLSIITPISFDHQKFLGNTLYEIAGEKAGIVRVNVPVVVGKQKKEAEKRIIQEAKSKHAPYFLYGRDFYAENFRESIYGTLFDFYSPYSNIKMNDLSVPLIGIHQAENASVAVQAAILLKEIGFGIDKSNIIKGLKKSFWPGRAEIINRSPLIILDGAHNGASARALKRTLNRMEKKRTIFLFGILRDKNISDVLSEICDENCIFVITEVPFSGKRRLSVDLLRVYVEKYVPKNRIIVEKNFKKAFRKAFEITSKNDLLCVTGSLYLVASVRKLMNRFVFSGNIL